MTYPAATANLVVLWGRWWDHLTKAGVDATITATPLLASGQAGSGSPNLVSLVDQAEIKTAAWSTKPLAASGLWALPLLPTNDAQFGAFGGYRIQAGSEPPFIVEILESTPTMAMSADMIAALNAARVQSNAAPIGISVNDVAQAVWVRQAAVLQSPAVAPPAGVLTSDQVVNLVAGVRQLPPGGTPGQVPTPKVGGGYEWVAQSVSGGGGSTTVSWPNVTDVPPNPIGIGHLIDQTGHIPRLVIATDGAAPIVDTDNYVSGRMTINGSRPYSGVVQVRGRGNTTWQGAKKPYRVKLAEAAPLLGIPTERDFVLLANFYDSTALRTSVAMEMGARCAGLAWTPRFRYVEVVLNDVFLGLYQLGEHVEISVPDKLAVTKVAGTVGLGLTGTYSMEIDQRQPTFRTNHDGLPIALDDPDGTIGAQKTYIQDWINNFESVLYSANWLDPTTGYRRFIDRASFIDWYLVNETMKNRDSNGFSSIKCYKTADTATEVNAKYLGPLWDFDLSLDAPATGFWTTVPVAGNTEHPGVTWLARMMSDPEFWAALVARWNDFKTALTTGDTIYAVVDRLTDRLSFSIARDKRVWSYSADNPALAETIKTYLRARVAWLSTQFIIDTTAPSVPTNLAAVPGNAQVALTWTASIDNVVVAKYRVRRGGTVIAELASTSYTDTGLANGTQYPYSVSAVDQAGNESAQTTAINATPTAADASAPTTPTGLTATPGDGQVALAWTASTDNVGVAKYRVRVAGTVVGEPTTTSFTHTGRTNGTSLSYTVSALDAAGNESAQTAAVTATPTAFNPSQLSGLTGWYDASDATTLFADTAGATPATTADTPVARWNDKSGNGRHATQATTAKQPLLKKSVQASRDVLLFDGVNDSIATAVTPSTHLKDGFSVFAVARFDAAASTGWTWLYGNTGGAGGNFFFGKTTGSSDRVHYAAEPWHVAGNADNPKTWVDAAWHQFMQQGAAGVRRAAIDGTLVSDTVPTGTGTLTATDFHLGASPSRDLPWTGPIAEIVVYNRVLTAAERAQIATYLRTKWAAPAS